MILEAVFLGGIMGHTFKYFANFAWFRSFGGCFFFLNPVPLDRCVYAIYRSLLSSSCHSTGLPALCSGHSGLRWKNLGGGNNSDAPKIYLLVGITHHPLLLKVSCWINVCAICVDPKGFQGFMFRTPHQYAKLIIFDLEEMSELHCLGGT